MNSKSGLMFGPNLILNSDLSSWTGDNPNNWTVLSEDSNNYITEASGIGARIVSDASSIVRMASNACIENGKTYKICIDIYSITSGYVTLKFNGVGSSIEEVISSVGVHCVVTTQTGNGTSVLVQRGDGGCDVTISSVTARELL